MVLLTKLRLIVYLFLTALYLLSPLDLIPEVVFGAIGLIDDLIIVGLAIGAISNVFYNVLVERN